MYLAAFILAIVCGLSVWLYRVKYVELALPASLLSGGILIILLAFIMGLYLVPLLFVGTAWWYYARGEDAPHWQKPLFMLVAFLTLGGTIAQSLYHLTGCADRRLANRQLAGNTVDPTIRQVGTLVAERYNGKRVLVFYDPMHPLADIHRQSLREGLGRNLRIIAELPISPFDGETVVPLDAAFYDNLLQGLPERGDVHVFLLPPPEGLEQSETLRASEQLRPAVVLAGGFRGRLKRESLKQKRLAMVLVPRPDAEDPPAGALPQAVFDARYLMVTGENLAGIAATYPELTVEK